MFDKLLIVNRGEIALRIQRAARSLGITCIQAYSEADRDASYVRSADVAICIGPAPARDSYLNICRILAAAEATRAQAVHPGYGFLSENAEFARRVNEAKMVFVGPAPEVIARLGDKIEAKATMIASDVPCVPGLSGEIGSDPDSLAQVLELGLPVLVKAAGGGGGRGMRIVREPGMLAEAIATTQQEAAKAFGNSAVYAEKFLEKPRHIEIQVLADAHGNCLWIGARDCSVQRRHQKVVEECPPPQVPPELLSRVGARCVAACQALGYVGLGTFEFLYAEGELYFIEVNTRLQVEHTITEAIADLDLVQYQLRVARGERLDIAQDDIRLSGHAIECRINAEDPRTQLPCPGRIDFVQFPGGPGVRVDSHIHTGYVVPPNYDSMIAKVIAYGRDRTHALDRMQAALRQFVVEGIRTNIPLHLEILSDPDFRIGAVDTGFLERRMAAA
jgi:acetyl-CoA carboxylase, biotin carboxylase subunit